MEITISGMIICAVTDDGAKVKDVPAFIVKEEAARQEKARLLSRILKAAVHDLGDGVLIVVRH
ncbi:MAG: capping complex subunit for YIEGIA [Bacillota bacterium]|nr:hypothetical protein [Candidatus Fermentithermobacillaceae bacterium]